MDDKRAGGILAAVTITIAVAFSIITLLFIRTSRGVATQYAESSTALYASEISSEVGDYIHTKLGPVTSSLLDEELNACLALEQTGLSTDDVEQRLRPLLAQLVVGEGNTTTFVVSKATGEQYCSDGTHKNVATAVDEPTWEAVVGGSRDVAGKYFTQYEVADSGRESTLMAARRLVSGGDTLGMVGVGIPSSELNNVINGLDVDERPSIAFFDKQGSIVFCTDEQVRLGSSVYEAYPTTESFAPYVDEGDVSAHLVWEGIDELMPRDQRVYEITYREEFGAYVLVQNSADGIFATMRARVTTLVLALVVVMVMLLLLVMFIVRWYRTQLIKAATTDELTGLANRKSFVSSYTALGEEGFAEAHLALIDVDKFKGINDTYGHAVGDKALAAVAREVRALVGQNGISGRWGGDEFIAMLTLPREEAIQRTKSFIDAVASVDLGDGVRVSVSVGLAHVEDELTLEQAVERSDDALYVTKEGGRGFLTVYEPGVTPHVASDGSSDARTTEQRDAGQQGQVEEAKTFEASAPSYATSRTKKLVELCVLSMLEAVHKMIPFVAGGGILIAIAFLVDAASVDLNALSAEARASFGSITPIASGLHDVGAAAFNFMLPIFAAFFARGLAGDEAFMAGFAGGYLASQGSAGYLGAIAAAAVAAIVVNLMRGLMRDAPRQLQRIAPVLLYPVFSLLIMYLLMNFLIEPVATAFDALLTTFLTSLASGSRLVLGAVCGAFMATDMGGPINKAAYHFGTASIAAGSPDIMAAVMVGGMVPPCGIALSMLFFRQKYTAAEFDQGPATLFMGLSFITEGAIPFVLTDILRVIPSCMAGSAVAGLLSECLGCTLVAPHGGVFVFPVVAHPLLYCYSLVVGSIVTALMLGLLKKPASE